MIKTRQLLHDLRRAERLSGVKTEPTPEQKRKATRLAIIGLAVSALALVGAFGALIVGLLALVF